MNHYINALLIGLTTVFAWTPATILVLLALFGIYTGILYSDEVGIVRLLALGSLGFSAAIGYIGLTSICWGLKLNRKARLVFLLIGLIGLICVITIGFMSENPILHIGFNIEDIYLFICPLLFLFLHAALDSLNLLRSSK
jgi:hypothetical protein